MLPPQWAQYSTIIASLAEKGYPGISVSSISSWRHGGYVDWLTAQQQAESRLGIVIEDDVWVGAGVRVMDGVRIGRGSVIGAGAVVTKSIPPNSVAVGMPARVVGQRGEKQNACASELSP